MGENFDADAHPFSVPRERWTDCAETWCVVRGPLAMRFTQNGGTRASTRIIVHTFKHICSLPLVHPPEGVLLVTSGSDSARLSLRKTEKSGSGDAFEKLIIYKATFPTYK